MTKFVIPPLFDTLSRIAMTISFCFYVFVSPAMVATGKVKTPSIVGNRIIAGLAIILYSGFWMFIGNWTLNAAAALYGFKAPFSMMVPVGIIPGQTISTFDVIAMALGSYVLTIYTFALAYAYLSRVDASFFNTPIDLLSATYFSVTTMTTVGFGDIHPTRTLTKLLVVCEIFSGILYAVIIFSLVATFAARSHGRFMRNLSPRSFRSCGVQ